MLQFEDTLSEEDHRNFNLIYESLHDGRKGREFDRFNIGDGVS